jgi:hypothetical protein
MHRSGLRPSLGWRIRRFLGSAGHVVGMLFAIGGLLLLNNGITSGPIGLALIGVLYVTGYFLAARPKLTPLGAPRSTETAKVSDQVDEMLAAIRRRVPDDVYYRVRSIRDAVIFTLESSGPHSEADPSIHMVRQTATTYLPEALSTYLALPRDYAENELVDGKHTSHDLLLDQLTLMDYKTRKVADEVIRRGSQELVTHGRFLADRYGESDLTVSQPPDAPEPERIAEPARR